MQIRVKLMGALKPKTPEGGTLDVSDRTTVAEVLETLDIPAHSVQVITINGTVERDRERSFADGDEFSVIPPVGGG